MIAIFESKFFVLTFIVDNIILYAVQVIDYLELGIDVIVSLFNQRDDFLLDCRNVERTCEQFFETDFLRMLLDFRVNVVGSNSDHQRR